MARATTIALRPEDHEAINKEMLEGSDFACALLGASVIDLTLRGIIMSHLKRTDKHLTESLFNRAGAPFSSLSHKITYAEASGLVLPKDARRLHGIRRIRNEFAHRAEPLSFDSPDIGKLTAQLGEPTNFSNRNQYIRATMLTMKRLMDVSIRQLGREITTVTAKHKRKIAALERKHARLQAEIQLARDLQIRAIRNDDLSKNERAKLRRLRAKIDRLYPKADTPAIEPTGD